VAAHPALERLRRGLEELEAAGLRRRLVTLGAGPGPWLELEGRPVLVMASNDYLGLTGHPRLLGAARDALLREGAGSGASRLVSGTRSAHTALEQEIAAFKHTDAALYLATGYMTNLALITALAGPGDLVVSDRLNHASIVDACRLSRARVAVYPHGDAAAAARLLREGEGRLKLLVSDGVFSMDGDLAPLPELLEAARSAGALLVVDDAHATGVWGASGRGSLEHFGLGPAPDIVQMGTFSKALGGQGGFVAAAPEVIHTLVSRARPLLYSTAPPPAQVAAAREGLRVLQDEPWRRDRLHALAARLRRRLEELGLGPLPGQGPIVPVVVGEAERALALSRALLRRGVFVPAIRPPTVPPGMSRLRFSLSAAHREADVELAAAALAEALQEVES